MREKNTRNNDEDERNVVDDATEKDGNVCQVMNFYCFTLFWACFNGNLKVNKELSRRHGGFGGILLIFEDY